jgi:hypothetical protein
VTAVEKVDTLHTYSPMKMEQTVCSETLAFKLQTPGNNPEESIRHSKQGESLKSRKIGESNCNNRPLIYVTENTIQKNKQTDLY